MARLFAAMRTRSRRTSRSPNACTFSLDELQYEYPDEPVPAGKTPQSHLEDLTWEGAAWRFPDGMPDKVRDTLRKELALIAELNYAPYFLTVHDIVHYAREPKHPLPGPRLGRQFRRLLLPRHHHCRSRPRSISCSSASSRPSARSRPTSTSISSMSGARR